MGKHVVYPSGNLHFELTAKCPHYILKQYLPVITYYVFTPLIYITEDVESAPQPALAHPSLYRSSSMEVLSSTDDFTEAMSAPPPSYGAATGQSPLDRRVEQYKQLQVSLIISPLF